MRYRVDIPAPTSSRMAGGKVVTVGVEGGWEGGEKRWQFVLSDEVVLDFDVPDDLLPRGVVQALGYMDMEFFTVRVRYENSSGSRFEEVELVPRRVDGVL